MTLGSGRNLWNLTNIDYCIKIGATALQNCDGNLFDSKCFNQCDTGKGSEKILQENAKQVFLCERPEMAKP